MQLPVLVYLTLMWILQSQAKDDPHWKINVTQTINATKGSNAIISCTFETPPELKTTINVYWKTKGSSSCSEKDKDKLAFAFHPNSSCIHPHFQRRTKLTGEASEGNCSLQIFNITEGEPSIYLRVSGLKDSYSFKKQAVKFYVDEKKLSSLSHTDDPSIEFTTTSAIVIRDVHDDGNIKLYLTVLVPLLPLLIIAAAGIVAYKMHKRSHEFKRQESGYYANFRQTSSTPPKSESFCKASDQIPPDPKVIDEHVYMNFQILTNQMDRQVETIDNIYGNVNYST